MNSLLVVIFKINGNDRESAKTEALRTSYQQSMDELRREKVLISSYTLFVHMIEIYLQEMLERQLEYERVRLEAESRKASLESQEKVHVATCMYILY